jgi:hypothetical protein
MKLNVHRRRYYCRVITTVLALGLASPFCHSAFAQSSSPGPDFATKISPSQAPAAIDSVMIFFYNAVYLPASAAQSGSSVTKVNEGHPVYPKYGQWLTDVAAAIKGNIELDDHAASYDDLSVKAMQEFKDLVSHAEFSPPKDVDLQRAQIQGLDLRTLGPRLSGIFHNQPAQTRKAAAAYLIRHYQLR